MTKYYTYYSYENNKGIDGSGYIGYRSCPEGVTPEEDDYYGTPSSPKNAYYKDKSNKNKIILGTYETEEEALAHEVYLHELWMVDKNEHFANEARQRSEKFHYSAFGEDNPRYGKYFKHTEESKQKISEKTKKENNPFYGKKHTEETLEKISGDNNGMRKKGGHTEESKNKIAESVTGEKNPFYGKSHTEKTKKEISDKNKGKFDGKKNPAYDSRKYNWYNEIKGIIERELTSFELNQKYPELLKSNLSSLKTGRQRSHKGWTILSDI